MTDDEDEYGWKFARILDMNGNPEDHLEVVVLVDRKRKYCCSHDYGGLMAVYPLAIRLIRESLDPINDQRERSRETQYTSRKENLR